jgi:FKBP-type peptidyl-prolyl cis-trans isomerase FkpA
MKGSDGTVLQEVTEGPNMPVLKIPIGDEPLPKPNPVVEMLMNGALGDSMSLIFPIDSFPNKNNPQLAGMEYIEYVTCIKKIKDETGYQAEIEEARLKAEVEMEASKARLDDVAEMTEQTLQDYKAGKLDVQTTPEGLKYIIHEEGDGPFGEKGKKASVHYYGTLMNGTMFDNSFKRGQPYPFTVGRGEVIQGWDLGIPLLKKGGKATLFIPYTLAYGEAGKPPTIPEKAELIFYVELMDVM